jgi:hypothetical protein
MSKTNELLAQLLEDNKVLKVLKSKMNDLTSKVSEIKQQHMDMKDMPLDIQQKSQL